MDIRLANFVFFVNFIMLYSHQVSGMPKDLDVISFYLCIFNSCHLRFYICAPEKMQAFHLYAY